MKPKQRISAAIDAARADGRTALVAFLTAGYPERDRFAEQLTTLTGAADVVEIGVPFSDPMADGLTIQRASQAAIEAGVNLGWILDQIETVSAAAPLVLMSYLNPLLAFGFERLAERAAAVGVDGFIVPDLPLDESEPLAAALDAQGLALIQLVTPVTTDQRLAAACAASTGFVYAVTVTGITGGGSRKDIGKDSGDYLGNDLGDYLQRVVAASTVPVCAGFGVREPEQVTRIGRYVPGVIVGSALVEAMERGQEPADFIRWLAADKAS
ncbi:MAG: tryptophan synthase subunit alpha [Gammaproteobacteria bacterium]